MLRVAPLLVAACAPLASAQKTDVERLTCAVNVAQATFFLAEAGNSINEGVLECPESEQVCAAIVSKVIGAVAYVASFTSFAVSACGQSVNIAAFCTGDVSEIVNALAMISVASSSFAAGSCSELKRRLWKLPQGPFNTSDLSNSSNGSEAPADVNESSGFQPRPWPVRGHRHGPLLNASNASEELGRRWLGYKRQSAPRLTAVNGSEKLGRRQNGSEAPGNATERGSFDLAQWPEYRQYRFLGNNTERVRDFVEGARERELERRHRGTALATCVISTSNVLLFLLRAGIILNEAVTDCSPESLEAATGREGEMRCTVGISGFVASLQEVASFLSVSVHACPVEDNLDALCAADLLDMLSAFSDLVAAGTALPLSCGKVGQPIPPDFEVQTLPARRLAAAGAGRASVLV